MGKSLEVGEAAPEFRLQDGGGQWVHSPDLWRSGPAVSFFYPRDDTTICTAEACAFQGNLSGFEELGATVVGVSADSVASHQAFAGRHGLTYTLLSDAKNEARRAFGVPKTLGVLAGRSTYVIDQEGIIRHAYHAQISASGHVEEALEAVRELLPGQGTGSTNPP